MWEKPPLLTLGSSEVGKACGLVLAGPLLRPHHVLGEAAVWGSLCQSRPEVLRPHMLARPDTGPLCSH